MRAHWTAKSLQRLQQSAVTPKAGIATWTAAIICADMPGKLRIVFESSAEGGDFSGCDSVIVSKRDWRGRLIELLGDAFHVVKHLDITIKGAIRYRRVTRQSNSAVEQDAPQAARRSP